MNPNNSKQNFKKRVDTVFAERFNDLTKKTDRMFGYLFIFQWLLGIAFALIISPHTWSGEWSQVHIHVYAAVFLGGLTAAVPIFFAFRYPGATLNRMMIAVSQILFSILFIHLTGGRIESHFHVFGSLAFLAIYRDWRPIIIATVVTAVDHLVRGAFFPQSVYGVLSATPWRAFEHAAWVLFEDSVLLYSIKHALEELRSVAESQVKLEDKNEQLLANIRSLEDEKIRTKTLTEVRRDLEVANQELDAFASAASHDLRAPLRSITGFIQILREDFKEQIGGDALQYFDKIVNSAMQMSKLIEALLELSRFGRNNLKIREVDLTDLTYQIMRDLCSTDASRKVEWIIQAGVKGHGDATMLQVIIQNLIRNAWKYSKNSVPSKIEFGTDLGEESQCVYFVKDNGAGFDMAHSGLLFQPFQRLHARSEFEGTGVGLATVQRIVHRHGGKIWADAKVGEGAKFSFTLGVPPLIKSDSKLKSVSKTGDSHSTRYGLSVL
ncbi:MAG: ATP-binding protein [Bdellovibrionia bacterium]